MKQKIILSLETLAVGVLLVVIVVYAQVVIDKYRHKEQAVDATPQDSVNVDGPTITDDTNIDPQVRYESLQTLEADIEPMTDVEMSTRAEALNSLEQEVSIEED